MKITYTKHGDYFTAWFACAGGENSTTRSVWTTLFGIPQAAPPRAVYQPKNHLQTEWSSCRCRSSGALNGWVVNLTDGSGWWRHGNAQGLGSNGLGRRNKQYPQQKGELALKEI